MIEVNVNKILGKMAEKNLNQKELAGQLDVTTVTLRTYLREPTRMPYRIMNKMADILCDSWKEAKDIFFVENLRKHK